MRDEPADEHLERSTPGPPRPMNEHYRTPGQPTRLPLSALDQVLALGGYLFLVSLAVCALYGLWLIVSGATQ